MTAGKEKVKVLVVDDDSVVRHAYKRSLAGANCNVVAAGDGMEALGMMEEDPCDVALVDIRMPRMDGIELLRRLKERWPECEVVVITGYPSIDTAKEAVRLGAFNYIAKPIGPREVIEATTGAVTQKRWSLREDRSGGLTDGRQLDYRYPWEH